MKKLITLFIILILIACQKQIVPIKSRYTPVNVGTAPNAGNGDNLRAAFIKVNAGFVDVYDSLTHKVKSTYVINRVHDSLQTRIAGAYKLGDYAWLKTDTVFGKGKQVVSQTQLANYEGGGSGVGMYELSGIINHTAGIPEDGDSLIINTGFITHPRLLLYRNGARQWYYSGRIHNTGFLDSTYVFNQATGTIIVRPVFATGERLYVDAFDPIVWHDLIPEGGYGGGGGGGGSTLLTGLKTGWKLDETSGTAVADVLGIYNGTTNATVNVTGLFGKAESFVYASSQYATFGSTVGDMGTSDFSYSCRIYIPSLASANRGIMGNFSDPQSFFYLRMDASNDIIAIINFTGANIMTYSNASISASTWYNLVVTCDRSGNQILYLNGTAQTDVDDISAGVAVALDNGGTFNIGNIGSATGSFYFDGIIDDIYLWNKVLSPSEVTELVSKTYPFN